MSTITHFKTPTSKKPCWALFVPLRSTERLTEAGGYSFLIELKKSYLKSTLSLDELCPPFSKPGMENLLWSSYTQ